MKIKSLITWNSIYLNLTLQWEKNSPSDKETVKELKGLAKRDALKNNHSKIFERPIHSSKQTTERINNNLL